MDFPIFPLGSVLFPHMPLSLRIFEERYVVMLSRVLQQEPSEFGVVLIERGQEVGGGEQRFTTGTVARIAQLEAAEGFIGLVAEGGRRIRIDSWGEDAPHPTAQVTELPDLQWDDDLLSSLVVAEDVVRAALADLDGGPHWSSEVQLADDPIARAWQIAGIAPLNELDQMVLLRSESTADLLERTIEATRALGDIRW